MYGYRLRPITASEAAFRGRFVFEGVQLGVYAGHRAAAGPGDPGNFCGGGSLGMTKVDVDVLGGFSVFHVIYW